MYQVFHKIASFFWPELKDMNRSRAMVGVGDVITVLYSIPIITIGLVWLSLNSNFLSLPNRVADDAPLSGIDCVVLLPQLFRDH